MESNKNVLVSRLRDPPLNKERNSDWLSFDPFPFPVVYRFVVAKKLNSSSYNPIILPPFDARISPNFS